MNIKILTYIFQFGWMNTKKLVKWQSNFYLTKNIKISNFTVYKKNPNRWLNTDHGDVSYMKGIKNKLKCKPFGYYFERVAPDMLERFPLVDPPHFSFGAVSLNYQI